MGSNLASYHPDWGFPRFPLVSPDEIWGRSRLRPNLQMPSHYLLGLSQDNSFTNLSNVRHFKVYHCFLNTYFSNSLRSLCDTHFSIDIPFQHRQMKLYLSSTRSLEEVTFTLFFFSRSDSGNPDKLKGQYFPSKKVVLEIWEGRRPHRLPVRW